MPYYNSLKDLPERVRDNLPEHAQHIFRDAFKVAWSAVEKEYEKDEAGKWVKK